MTSYLRDRPARMQALSQALGPLDPRLMTTAELTRICEDAVPDATTADIIDAIMACFSPKERN